MRRKKIGKKGAMAASDDDSGRKIEIKTQTIREQPKIIVNTGQKKGGFLSIIIAILIVLALFWFFFFTETGSATGSNIVAALGPFGQNIKLFFSKMFSLMSGSEEEFGWKNPNPVDVGENIERGIMIRSFSVEKPTYLIGGTKDKTEYIYATATVEAKNLEEDTKVDFSCLMDMSGAVAVEELKAGSSEMKMDAEANIIKGQVSIPSEGIEYTDKAPLSLKKGGGDVVPDKIFSVRCRIPKSEAANINYGDKKSFSGNVKLIAKYNAKTISYLRVYTIVGGLDKDLMDGFKSSLSKEGLLWICKEGIGCIVNPQSRGGAMDGFVSIQEGYQPFHEVGGSYFIKVGLKNKWSYGGLSSITDIKFTSFGKGMGKDSDNCKDFESGSLNKDITTEVNKCLEKKNDKYAVCDEYIRSDGAEFACAVKIEELKPQLGYELIKAEFDYEYGVKSSADASFNVVEKKTNP